MRAKILHHSEIGGKSYIVSDVCLLRGVQFAYLREKEDCFQSKVEGLFRY